MNLPAIGKDFGFGELLAMRQEPNRGLALLSQLDRLASAPQMPQANPLRTIKDLQDIAETALSVGDEDLFDAVNQQIKQLIGVE